MTAILAFYCCFQICQLLLPQGCCTAYFLYLECSSCKYLHGFTSHPSLCLIVTFTVRPGLPYLKLQVILPPCVALPVPLTCIFLFPMTLNHSLIHFYYSLFINVYWLLSVYWNINSEAAIFPCFFTDTSQVCRMVFGKW